MPIDTSRYPDDWDEISKHIRFVRAGNECEWCGAENYKPHPETGSRVILTVAHLGTAHPDGSPGDKTDKMDVRPENLAALCQRCHLNYDRDEHAVNRRETLRRKKLEAGQLELWPEPMRYTYLGDRMTRDELKGMQCDPVLRPDGKCIVSIPMATALVIDAHGCKHVVARRRLRLTAKLMGVSHG